MNTTKNHFWGHFVDIETNEFLCEDDITYLHYKENAEPIVTLQNDTIQYAEPTKGQLYTPHLLEQTMIKFTLCVITAIYVFNI